MNKVIYKIIKLIVRFALCVRCRHVSVNGIFTPSKISLTTIVTYLQKGYRSSILKQLGHYTCMRCGTSHLQTVQENILSHIILATYMKFTVATVRFTQNVSCNIYTHPLINKWQMSLCNNSSDTKSYWIHRVDVKVSAQVTTVTYMHQSQPSSHLLSINLRCTSNSDLAITWFGAMTPNRTLRSSSRIIMCACAHICSCAYVNVHTSIRNPPPLIKKIMAIKINCSKRATLKI